MTTSYAAHKALNEFYDEILGKADDLAEQYQGHVEMILEYPAQMDIPMLKTPEEAIIYLRNLYDKISSVQSMMTCSSIINTMDEAKALINSTKYKLIFLK
jgi:DNA-binding ferritin-like protein